MKNIHLHLILICSVLLTVDACRNKKSTTTSAPTTAQQQTTATTPTSTEAVVTQPVNATTPPKEEAAARFIASFYSIGEGVDEKLNGEFVKFLDSYPKKIAYVKKNWGRGGEFDYCLDLNGFSDVEKDEFARKAKKILSTNVAVDENAACSHRKTETEEKYRLVISFFSIGEGVNLKVNEEFEKFISAYSPKVKHELVAWGREGEKDYCFKLTELSSVQQEEFIRKAKEVATKKVHIKENEQCPH